MTYRDPLEALQAENEHLRQELKDARDEIAASRGGSDAHERQRWAMGMRCLGGIAMMAPFLAIVSLCEHRAMQHAAWVASVTSASAAHSAALAPSPCAFATGMPGFGHFGTAIERPARALEASGLASVHVGDPCMVRVAPVSRPDFNCHVDVVCNGASVYGARDTGYAHCDVSAAAGVLRAVDAEDSDRDGDPAVTVDVPAGRVVVDDGARAHLVLSLQGGR